MKLISAIALLLVSCSQAPQNIAFQQDHKAPQSPDKVGGIPLPEGYKRITAGNNSFSSYSRNIPLKSDHTVYLFNGVKKGNQSAQYAVLDIDVALQTCNNAPMPLCV